MSLDKRRFCDILSNVQFLLDEKENDADKNSKNLQTPLDKREIE